MKAHIETEKVLAKVLSGSFGSVIKLYETHLISSKRTMEVNTTLL